MASDCFAQANLFRRPRDTVPHGAVQEKSQWVEPWQKLITFIEEH